MRIVVLMGGRSSEREISLKTGKAVAEGLRELGHEVIEMDLNSNTPCKLLEIKPDKVFIALHGAYGEDGRIQGMLDILGIPYTGTGVLGSSICMRKDITKKLLEYHGIKTPRWLVPENEEEVKAWNIFPCIVKPIDEGSSVDLYICNGEDELAETTLNLWKKGKKIMVEEFIKGKDVTVGLLKGKPLPPIEIRPKKGIYDYESKYTKGKTEYVFLEDKELTDQLYKISSLINDIFELKDMARVDFRITDKKEIFTLEINTIPGMTELSLLPMASERMGIDFRELLHIIIT